MKNLNSLNPDQFVVKGNSLVEARYRLSLQESHVILWLLTQIQPEDEDFKMHSMKISDFAKMIDVKVDSQYKELRKVTMRLIQRGLSIYEPDTKEWIQVSWLSAARYKTKQGMISFRFDPALKPYLLQLKERFTKINIADSLKFKSVYTIRIFELLLQYQSIGKRNTDLEELRNWCGIEKGEYKLYSGFKRDVMHRAKEEINVKTEYAVDYKEIKESRKVVAINWSFQKKTHFEKAQLAKSVAISHELEVANKLINALCEYGFTKQSAQKILISHDEKTAADAIQAVEIYRSKHDVKNPKALILSAIKEQWKSNEKSS